MQPSFISKKRSKLQSQDLTFVVWSDESPHLKKYPSELFVKCQVLKKMYNGTFLVKQIAPQERGTFEVRESHLYNANLHVDPLRTNDIGSVPHSNPPAVLDFLRQRFLQKRTYCTADPLLVLVNPFVDLRDSTESEIARYYRGDLTKETLQPHVFHIAKRAVETMHSVGISQSIIVSGESGAGKTEAVKTCMRYFAYNPHRKAVSGVQEVVLAANPVIEAFGNAKTTRNDNSSRFGRFMQFVLKKSGGIVHATVQGFLLEKTRVITQGSSERSYHVFYQLVKGLDGNTRRLLGLRNSYPCLGGSATRTDAEDWAGTSAALRKLGIEGREFSSLLKVLVGILTLSNVEIIGTDEAVVKDRAILDEACQLLGLDSSKLALCLTKKELTTWNQVVFSNWRGEDSAVLKESLGKAIYDFLFQWILQKVNGVVGPRGACDRFLGMLDIFGFEVFENNSLEQVLINLTNEFLQKNFVEVVFANEYALYRRERIPAPELVWTSNAPVINLLMGPKGLLAKLEDACLAPSPKDTSFLSSFYASNQDSNQLIRSRVSSDKTFVIAHTIGQIHYSVDGFIAKNRDVLRAEFLDLVKASSDPLVRTISAHAEVPRGKLPKGLLIGTQFTSQLKSMMAIINTTESHFIRCVKPNDEQLPLTFVPAKVLPQIYALSILEALQLRALGFSYRRPFEEFLVQFRFIDLSALHHPDARAGCAQVLEAASVPSTGFRIGCTMVFLTRPAVRKLVALVRESLAAWQPLIATLESLFLAQQSVIRSSLAVARCTRLQAQTHRAVAVGFV
ncbi:MAG: hypothetical protein KVP17_001860 [Porospora cf. gigantea B]|uniref:uncharacterized protein n=1 Tax=Porospora cf. gigantea B TaxID=2853592 RepID=UPI003571EF4A|nr:MAG: hypothetical protein KVP17_001860 [Porospora cf. gigantea B]